MRRFVILLALAVALVVPAGTFSLTAAPLAFAATTDAANEVNPFQIPDSSFIYDTSIAELAGADSYLDGQTVQVVGEAVGDNLRANADGSYRWITLMAEDGSDGSVVVYMTKLSADLVGVFGEYGVTGTTLQVRGTFNLACAEHEGLSDLHATSVSVIRKGTVHEDSFDVKRFIPGAACAVLGLLLTILFYFRRERLR